MLWRGRKRRDNDGSGSPPDRWFTLFGLVVVRRTDLLAAAAFVLSLSTISYQLWQFARGARPAIYHPDTVYVFFDKYANGVVATRVAGQISFTNGGEPGQNAIVRDVSVAMTVAGRTIEEYWLSFATVTRKNIELSFDIKESAHPIVVPGGGASSYMITFSPRVKTCAAEHEAKTCEQAGDFVSDTEFLKLLSPDGRIVLRFVGTIFGSRPMLESTCIVTTTQDLIRTLAKNDWYAARCASDKPA